MSSPDIRFLLALIETQLAWGDSDSWHGRDFENLSELILEKTKVSLSASTLKRLWGRAAYRHTPNVTTLDALSRFAGYESWRSFLQQRARQSGEEKPAVLRPGSRVKHYRRQWIVILLAFSGLIFLAICIRRDTGPLSHQTRKGNYKFSFRPVTRSLPNSVIFSYDAGPIRGDSVYIQQSWDARSSVRVNPNLHTYTSVYYRPGVYHAKLLINQEVIKEKVLMIPTTGWLGLISRGSVPVYLKPAEFIRHNSLQFPVSAMHRKNIAPGPEPPWTEYDNLGNFAPAPLKNFSFEAALKNDDADGAAACQLVVITLFTDSYPIIVKLSSPGCIARLRLFDGSQYVSGRDHDLSGFGADFSKWVRLSIQSEAGRITYDVNGRRAFESSVPAGNHSINGVGFAFLGTGSVKNIFLKSGPKINFSAF